MKTSISYKKPKLGTWPRLQVAAGGHIILMKDPFEGTVIHGEPGDSLIGLHSNSWEGLKDFNGTITISTED